jgi:predicted RNA-binding Zn-ribbon protein involved in translation (DUF1610 family)
MLIAKDKDGARTIGVRARHGERYTCPACGEKVIPRKGEMRIHHFAHVAESRCASSTGETALHLEMKSLLRERYGGAPYIARAEVEWTLADRVTDVYLEGMDGTRVAIECQVTPIEDRELMKRTVAYSRQGVHVLWLLAGCGALDTIVSRLKDSRVASLPYRAGEVEKRLQRLYDGRFYYYFKGGIFPVHMEDSERWVDGSCDGCRRQFSCSPEEKGRCDLYKPGFMSRTAQRQQVTIGALYGYRPLCIERSGGLRLARFRDKRWWGTTAQG